MVLHTTSKYLGIAHELYEAVGTPTSLFVILFLSGVQGLPLAACTFFYKFDLALSYGVTVAQQILNLFVLVRIQVAQLSRPGKSGPFLMELLG